MEPGSRHVPVARHRVFGNVQHARDFFVVQAAEIPQLDHLTAPRIHFREALQRFVEPEHVGSDSGGDAGRFIERDLTRAAAAFILCVIMLTPGPPRRIDGVSSGSLAVWMQPPAELQEPADEPQDELLIATQWIADDLSLAEAQ